MRTNILELFDQVRIINLVHRVDRRSECLKEYARWGLPTSTTTFLTATKPSSVPQNWRHMPVGVYGCFMSHLTVLQEFLTSKDDNMLVLEDDIRFVAPWSELLATLPEADLTFFGVCAPTKRATGWRMIPATEAYQGLHCYGIRRAAAIRLVAYLQACITRPDGHPDGGPMHVDGAINMFRAANPDITMTLVEPHLAVQRASATNIHETPRQRLNDLPLIGRTLAAVRSVRNAIESL